MASILTEKELNLLDANLVTVVGQKPYEDGIWGAHPNKDFVHFQIFDKISSNFFWPQLLFYSNFKSVIWLSN